MSRIGRMPIELPQGTSVQIAGGQVTVKGPHGELKRSFDPEMTISQEGNKLTVTRPSDNRKHRAMHGLTRSLLANMVEGVSRGFEKHLEIVGVGYRAEKSGENLTIRVGYSHPVNVTPPAGVTLATEGLSRIKVAGIDKEAVGEMAAKIRAIRLPDSYKGKGIRYAGEVVRLKPGKAGKVVGKK
ncbi:MAG: 50S ribosomal protein L6 [Chloroflexota bacterium]